MNIVDELEKLQQMHESGALSDEEFAKAKAAVLSGPPLPRSAGGEDEGLVSNIFGDKKETLGHAANRFVSFQKVMAVVVTVVMAVIIILMLLFFFGFFLPMWNRFPRP